jgi:hypothetical protein
MADKIVNPYGKGVAATTKAPTSSPSKTKTSSGTPGAISGKVPTGATGTRTIMGSTYTPSTGTGYVPPKNNKPRDVNKNKTIIEDTSTGDTSTGEGTDTGTGNIDLDALYEQWLNRQNQKERVSAFKILEDAFNTYGLGSLVPAIQNFLRQGLSDDEAVIELRKTPEYKTRFKGNEGRLAKGLAAYSESDYLTAEQTYRDILAQSGLENLATRDTFSQLIGGAVSAAEVNDRINNVFNKIDNADAKLKEQIGNYLTGYGVTDPNVQRTQLASALLTGGTNAQELVRGIEKAQIKTAALTAGVNILEEDVTGLQKQLESSKTYDVYGTAKKAFGEIAANEPTLTKLANIYGEDAATLKPELQQEAFFGLASQRRKKLQEKEQATFGGQAGTSTASLSQGLAGSI